MVGIPKRKMEVCTYFADFSPVSNWHICIWRCKEIMMSFQVMGPPPALKNYHAWLFENGFNVELPNPTNEVVASYYGVKPLWKTDYSQGIVVMAEDESDYFIVMECSSRNRGYKHTKIILTMGGCM